MTDEQLFLEARDGSREAFEALFERYRAPMWRFFRRRTPDAGRAEELAQDTFVALLEAAPRYEARAAFRSFLFGIAYNILLADHRRVVRWHTEALDEDPIGASPDPDAAMWIRHALSQLESDDREILMLREYDELS